MNKEYLNLANEISEKIRTIKSEECIMHYDDKTELIKNLKKNLHAHVIMETLENGSEVLRKWKKDFEVNIETKKG